MTVKIRVKISVSLTHLMLIPLCNHENISEFYFISIICACCEAVYTLGSKTSMNPPQYDYVSCFTCMTTKEKYILNTNISFDAKSESFVGKLSNHNTRFRNHDQTRKKETHVLSWFNCGPRMMYG